MVADPAEYTASHIKKTRWGAVTRRDDGTWQTTWSIGFVGDVVLEQDAFIHEHGAAGFRSHLAGVGPGEAELVVVSREHAMSAVNYSPTFASFRIVDEVIGEIERIQGLPRDWYAPFRNPPTC